MKNLFNFFSTLTTSLTKGQWKQVKKEGVSPPEIKDFVQHALKISNKVVFLFDTQDENLHTPPVASWTAGGPTYKSVWSTTSPCFNNTNTTTTASTYLTKDSTSLLDSRT